MASHEEDLSPTDDRFQRHPPIMTPGPGYAIDAAGPWQNGGHGTPEPGIHRQATGSPGPKAPGMPDDRRPSSDKNRQVQRAGRSASGQQRVCKKCGEPLTGQFVRALDGTFHLDCFRCRDCGQIVASKFFPADDGDGEGQYPLCETDYFRRLGLLCYQCGGALRGSYITALDRKYHVDHFTCSLCSTVFGAQDSYYEHDGNVYCHFHYSTRFAQRCNGCQTAILKQFVEIFRNGQNQHWHPECYMIHKFWNVRLTPSSHPPPVLGETDDQAIKDGVRDKEELMEEKVYRIWSVLSTFEESSAACISDMLLHVSNGAYVDGVLVAKRFICHVEVLFSSADRLDVTMRQSNVKALSYGREAKLLCKKIVAFFSLLSKTQDTGTKKLGVTQELLSLVTGLAHYLKLLIRICLQGALRLERDSSSSDGLYKFLDDLNDLESLKSDDRSLQIMTGSSRLSAKDSDHCSSCGKSVEDECAQSMDKRWHIACVKCSNCDMELGRQLEAVRYNPYDKSIYCTTCGGVNSENMQVFEHVTKLQQYVFLLKVALARLLDILKSNGALPDEDLPMNGSGVTDAARGESADRAQQQPPYLTSDSRSKSYAGEEPQHRRESSYENTLNDVRRLRSTRLDKHLSASFRKARTSRVMDGQDGRLGPDAVRGPDGQVLNDEDVAEATGTNDMMFGHQDALTLDDIPRIVAAEQVREQYNPERQDQFRSPGTEHSHGHQRSQSTGRNVDMRAPPRAGRKFFSELSALEYFNVRHLAVLTMHPHLEPDFSLDELLGFIEAKKSATFWKNLGKAFKNDRPRAIKKKGVFGVPLEIIIDKDGAESTDGVGPGALKIPAIIDDMIRAMKGMDLSVEGVFRKNGNIKKLSDLAERIDRDGTDSVNLTEQPVVQIAALLKRYLRDLPDPLLTHKLYRLWLAVAKINDPGKRRQCLHLTCCLLPKAHRDTMEILFCFLKWAGSFHQVDEEAGSRMDIKNLATVIAPNILYAHASQALALDSNPMFAIGGVEDLIRDIEQMCLVPDEIMDLMDDPFVIAGGASADLTTKEILKRYHDRMGQRPYGGEAGEVHNRQDNSFRSPPTRVDTDPAVYREARSVRPVQEPPVPSSYGGNNGGGVNSGSTPPQQMWRVNSDAGVPHHGGSPYRHEQYTHSDPSLDPSREGQRREWRHSGLGRQNSGLGVGGNS